MRVEMIRDQWLKQANMTGTGQQDRDRQKQQEETNRAETGKYGRIRET